MTLLYSLKFAQEQVAPYRFHQLYLPTGVSTFQRNSNISTPIKYFTASLNASRRFSNYITSYSSIRYDHYFTSIGSSNYFNQLFQLGTDTVVRHSTGYLHASSNPSLSFTRFESLFEIGADYTRASRLLMRNKSLNTVFYNTYLGFITVKRNWNKKYFAELQDTM